MPIKFPDNGNSSSVAPFAGGAIAPFGPTDADGIETVDSGNGAGAVSPANPPASDFSATDVSTTDGLAGENDRFDPAKLRIDHTSSAALGAKRVILNVPVQKPPSQMFFRVHPSPDMRLDVLVIELKTEKETYLVIPELAQALAAEVKPVRLYTCLPRIGGGIFLWHVRLPDDTGREYAWHVSARKAAEVGMKSWIRVQSNMGMGCYDVMASDHIPEPEWPNITFRELLRIAFGGGRIIDSLDHPVIRQLAGL